MGICIFILLGVMCLSAMLILIYWDLQTNKLTELIIEHKCLIKNVMTASASSVGIVSAFFIVFEKFKYLHPESDWIVFLFLFLSNILFALIFLSTMKDNDLRAKQIAEIKGFFFIILMAFLQETYIVSLSIQLGN